MSPTAPGLADTRTLAAFILLASLSGIGVGLAKVNFALYALSLEASPLELGLVAGAQTAGLLLASLPCGMLVEQFGPLRLYLFGSLAAGSLFQLLPLVGQPLLLLLPILLIGLCMPCRLVSLNAVFMQQLAQVGEARAGWFRGSQMIGMLLLAPPLAALFAGWLGASGSWLPIGLLFVVPALLAPRVLHIYPARRQGAEPLSLAALGRQLGVLREQPALRDNCLLEFCVQAAAMFFSYFIVAITVQDYGWSAGEAAALLSAHGLAYIVALFGLGRLLGGSGQAGFAASLLLCAAALASLGLSGRAPLLWGGALLLGLGLGMLQVVTLSAYARHGAQLGHGRIAGLAVLAGPGGSLAGSVLGGVLGEWFGLQPLFLLFVPLFLGFLLRPSPQHPQPALCARRISR